MTRFGKLEDTFGIAALEDSITPEGLLKQAQVLDTNFKQVDPSELHDEEMDEIAQLAMEYGKTLHDLGMSVEVKHAGEIFNASGNMLKIASDARNSKMEKKLKLMKLEMDRIKMDRQAPDKPELINQDQVTVLDRNQLLSQIKALSQTPTK
jgi:hypothetical protein